MGRLTHPCAPQNCSTSCIQDCLMPPVSPNLPSSTEALETPLVCLSPWLPLAS